MNHVEVFLLGRKYKLACGPGEESRLRILAEDLGDRLNLLNNRFSSPDTAANRPPEIMLWIMTALTLLDEIHDLRQDLEYWKSEANIVPVSVETERRREIEAAMANTLSQLALRLEKLTQDE